MTLRSAERRSHSAVKRDVRFRRPRSLQELPIRHKLSGAMAAMSDRLAGAMALTPFEPLDGHRFADRVVSARRPAVQRAPPHRVDHPVAQVCEYGIAISCWPPPSRLNADSGIPSDSAQSQDALGSEAFEPCGLDRSIPLSHKTEEVQVQQLGRSADFAKRIAPPRRREPGTRKPQLAFRGLRALPLAPG